MQIVDNQTLYAGTFAKQVHDFGFMKTYNFATYKGDLANKQGFTLGLRGIEAGTAAQHNIDKINVLIVYSKGGLMDIKWLLFLSKLKYQLTLV